MRWIIVLALRVALVGGTLLTSLVPDPLERAADNLCDRYEELYGLPFTGLRLDPEARDALIDEIWALARLEELRPADVLRECEGR